MCPFCLSTVGVVVAGSLSTGGLAALVAKISRSKGTPSETDGNAGRSSETNDLELRTEGEK